ncbi:hypothetical protein AARAC_002199 [Aspergillus arachidicola]|uniref:Clr5 domain-containing protein n=1 Tax=Aspergillus arachidicola TaxID=656916 RepID=A0A2G7FN23_9EURO|nr:hypothetical protein AARAC_002199 [Aspergillus arachidicola]
MKHTISFRMWEMKRGLIIKLYQEEEWPLKQVLKRIRSDTFNPRFIHPALGYYNPAIDRPKAELTSSQWPMTMSYGMLPEDVNNDSAARFYTTAPSGMFMHQPAQFTPFPPQSDWFHTPDCQLVYQPS